MATRLPLFALDMVLFPGTRASLHIFEPRYREMLAGVLAADGRFGLVAPGPDGQPPRSGSIGTIAHVEVHQPLPDGRSNILVRGEERFILRGIDASDTPYPLGRIEPFADEEGADELPGDLLERLRALGARCRDAMARLSDAALDRQWSETPAPLTFEIAAAMPWGPDDARPLLAMRSAAERAAFLLRVLPGMVPDLEQRAAVHHRAHTNGHGPHGAPAPGADT